jgi:hypothetical protein
MHPIARLRGSLTNFNTIVMIASLINPLAKFIHPLGFYDAQPITTARDEYGEYLRIPAVPYDKLLET